MRNYVELIGFLGNNPEIRVTPKGTEVAKINLATSRQFKDKDTGEYHNKTTWHNGIVAYGNKVNAVKLLKKGSKVFLQGFLEYTEKTDEQGKKQYYTNIIVEDLIFLDKKESTPMPPTSVDNADEDIPY